MVNHKVKAALIALEALTKEVIQKTKSEKTDSAYMRVSGFSKRLMALARDLYPLAHHIDPADGITKSEKFCAQMLYMAANSGLTKANKQIKRKAKGIAEIKAMMANDGAVNNA